MRSSRNQSTTGSPADRRQRESPKPSLERERVRPGPAAAEPPWPAEPAPQLAGPSGPETQSQCIRAGAGRGGRDRAARSRRAPPSHPLQPRCQPARQEHWGPRGGVQGVVVGEAWAAALRRDPPARASPGPPPQTGPEPAGDRAPSASSGRELSDPFPAPLPCPSPHPQLRESQTPPLDPRFETEAGTSIAPPTLGTRPFPAPRGTSRPWGVRPSISHPVPPGTRLVPQEVPGSPGLDRAGTWPGRAGPVLATPHLSPFKRFLPLCPFRGPPPALTGQLRREAPPPTPGCLGLVQATASQQSGGEEGGRNWAGQRRRRNREGQRLQVRPDGTPSMAGRVADPLGLRRFELGAPELAGAVSNVVWQKYDAICHVVLPLSLEGRHGLGHRGLGK